LCGPHVGHPRPHDDPPSLPTLDQRPPQNADCSFRDLLQSNDLGLATSDGIDLALSCGAATVQFQESSFIAFLACNLREGRRSPKSRPEALRHQTSAQCFVMCSASITSL
jgi:hypothetical protein